MSDTKICPYCGEEIQAAAKKCRYCGEWLDKTTPPPVPQNLPVPANGGTPVNANNADEEMTKEEALDWLSRRNGEETAGLLWGCGWRLALAIAAIWFVCATVPDEADHVDAIHEEARDLIRDQASSAVDFVVPGLGTFLNALVDSKGVDDSLDEFFDLNNSIEVKKGWFWSRGYVINESNPKGTLASFGICGIVIPLVTWDDIRILSDKEKDNFLNGKSDDEANATNGGALSSSTLGDWSMITPATLGSDEAFSKWCEEHPDWSRQTAEGSIDGNAIRIDVSHSDGRIVGRYYGKYTTLDLNGRSVGDTMYLQLGHGSEMSHAVLQKSGGHTWRGTWGKSDKRMKLVFSE